MKDSTCSARKVRKKMESQRRSKLKIPMKITLKKVRSRAQPSIGTNWTIKTPQKMFQSSKFHLQIQFLMTHQLLQKIDQLSRAKTCPRTPKSWSNPIPLPLAKQILMRLLFIACLPGPFITHQWPCLSLSASEIIFLIFILVSHLILTFSFAQIPDGEILTLQKMRIPGIICSNSPNRLNERFSAFWCPYSSIKLWINFSQQIFFTLQIILPYFQMTEQQSDSAQFDLENTLARLRQKKLAKKEGNQVAADNSIQYPTKTFKGGDSSPKPQEKQPEHVEKQTANAEPKRQINKFVQVQELPKNDKPAIKEVTNQVQSKQDKQTVKEPIQIPKQPQLSPQQTKKPRPEDSRNEHKRSASLSRQALPQQTMSIDEVQEPPNDKGEEIKKIKIMVKDIDAIKEIYHNLSFSLKGLEYIEKRIKFDRKYRKRVQEHLPILKDLALE